jgi:hypothetical protein
MGGTGAEGCSTTNTTNGNVVTRSFCAAVSARKQMIGDKKIVHTAPSITLPSITIANSKLMFMKEFNESRVGQGMSVVQLERDGV